MTSDKKIEGFDEAAASSVGADMACKYASDFVFNASGVYYIQVNSFVDGARWQWQQAQSKVSELEKELAIKRHLCGHSGPGFGSYCVLCENEQLQRRVAELEAEVLESEKLWGVQNEKKKEYRQQVDTILDEKRILEAESARLRSLVDYSREQFALLSDGEGNDIEVYRKFANVAMKFIDAALKGES